MSERLAQDRLMPTEIIAQNGAQIHETTTIKVEGCKKAKAAKKKKKKPAKKNGKR
jgi:hypothetical protein